VSKGLVSRMVGAPPHGLRVTVRLHGEVVSQRAYLGGRATQQIGGTAVDAVPTEGPIARARWIGPDTVEIASETAGVEGGRLTPGTPWEWSDGRGVGVAVDLIPARRMTRTPTPSGDLPFLILFFVLSTLAAQLSYLIEQFMPSGGASAAGQDPTPELIARLLQDELEGAERGFDEEVERPDFAKNEESYYLPSGNKGPLDRQGGGAVRGDDSIRSDPSEEEQEVEAEEETQEALPPSPPTAAPVEPVSEAPPEVAAPDAVEPPRKRALQAAPADPVERFIGWGFRDWMDRGAAKDMDPDLERTLSVARVRLKIDPDDPYAIQVVGYYAYLADEMDLSQAMYQKYVGLYPEDPSGYNNLALTYKRMGEYEKEEALYRTALGIDPIDDHVLNNLAVNLAHQGRSDEALEIMDRLEQLTPDDPYADLHRAKIYATMGKREKAYKYLKKALEGVQRLDTLHHIEFRQDIRVDPAFLLLRQEERFREIITQFYGDDARQILGGPSRRFQVPSKTWRRGG
jgi:tetratricopeptide (TPR) repeat protein